MKNTIKNICFTAIYVLTNLLQAQTEHGNGTKYISGSRYEWWDTKNSVWNMGDSMEYNYNASNKPELFIKRKYVKNFDEWQINGYTIFKYDNLGNEILYLDSALDPDIYFLRSKAVSVYNSDNKATKITRSSWNTNKNSWQIFAIYYMSYDSKGKEKTRVEENFFPHRNAMVPVTRYSFAYNDDGQQDYVLYENYDTITSQWVNYYRGTYLYDANGNETYSKSDIFESGVWVNASKHETVYNSDKQEVSNTSFKWSKASMDWVASLRNSFYYDDKKVLESVVSTWWNAGTQKWDNYSSSILGLDLFGRPTSYVRSTWDKANGKWVYEQKRASKFDNVGYETYRFTEVWDATNAVFVKSSKNYWSFKLKNTSDMVEIKADLTNILVYPNPVKNVVHIKAVEMGEKAITVSIIDAIGRVVLVKENVILDASGFYQFSLQDAQWVSGTYFIKIVNPMGSCTSTLIVE